ncbi:hypothetical protein ACO0OL_001478 [Hanseniaspora opuntiae]
MSQVVINKTGKEELVRSDDDIKSSFSYIDVLKKTDNLPINYTTNQNFIDNNICLYSHDNSFLIGYMLYSTYKKIANSEKLLECFNNLFTPLVINEANNQKSLTLRALENNINYDSLFESFANAARESNIFECTKGWRNEKYTIYDNKKTPYIKLERAMVNIFGILTFGVHINGYFFDDKNQLRMWIPRRSARKPTWPLKLDNVVAGGIGNDDTVDTTLWKELKEEANLNREDIENNIKKVDALSYFYFSRDLDECDFQDESDVITAELEFIYDLEFPKGVTPYINDDEVHEFKHYGLQELVDLLKTDDFKPNCALVVVDFLIRHKYITPENESKYADIMAATHRKLPFTSL